MPAENRTWSWTKGPAYDYDRKLFEGTLDFDGWKVDLAVHASRGVKELRIRDAGAFITKRKLTALPLVEIEREIRSIFRRQLTTGPMRASASLLDGMESAPRIGRPRTLDDRELAAFAGEYVKHHEAGRSPNKELSRAHNIGGSAVTDRVRLARSRGFLTQTTRGKAGGELTPKARALLAQRKDGT